MRFIAVERNATWIRHYMYLPMFEISDECYAVENAVDELKAAATGIIESNEADGVAKWLLEHALF